MLTWKQFGVIVEKDKEIEMRLRVVKRARQIRKQLARQPIGKPVIK